MAGVFPNQIPVQGTHPVASANLAQLKVTMLKRQIINERAISISHSVKLPQL